MNGKGRHRSFILILFGTLILSFGLFNIHNRSLITEGGILGLSLLFGHWSAVSPGIFSVILDVICYAVAFKYLGKSFIQKSLVATLCYFGWFMFHEFTGPLLPNLSSQPLIACIFGGMFVGVGVGLVVRTGGACGGDDALALIIHHKTKLNLSKSYLLSDLTVLVLSLSYIPYVNLIYSLITVTISSFLIGRIHAYDFKKTAASK